jgi:hypothetical protein
MGKFDQLIQMALENNRQKHPSFPDAYRVTPKYTDKTANGLTKCIVDYLNFSGHVASRINNMGTWRADKTNVNGGFYTRSNQMKGIADIDSTVNVKITGIPVGLSVKWEVKIGKDTQSEAQKEYEKKITASGGHYYIVKSFEDFLQKYTALILKYS